jgi:nuclear transport factor 2 (NTF2) superfamily protein
MTSITDPIMSIEEARRLVKSVEEAFAAADVPRILSGYTNDVVIRFADVPEIKGIAGAEKFLRARFARQRNYSLRKSLRAIMGNIVGNYWEGEWEDAQTGKQMVGRGTEFWTMRDGKVAVWEATFNAWSKDGGPTTPIM